MFPQLSREISDRVVRSVPSLVAFGPFIGPTWRPLSRPMQPRRIDAEQDGNAATLAY
jgi:hypothetical protein